MLTTTILQQSINYHKPETVPGVISIITAEVVVIANVFTDLDSLFTVVYIPNILVSKKVVATLVS